MIKVLIKYLCFMKWVSTEQVELNGNAAPLSPKTKCCPSRLCGSATPCPLESGVPGFSLLWKKLLTDQIVQPVSETHQAA